jgi:hypothetical protein
VARRREDSHTGRSGQLAVMAELLMRGCNAAIPEVDEGTDVLAFREDRPPITRLQVKTARAKPYRRSEGYSAQFSVPLRHLYWRDPGDTIVYAFAVRSGERFTDFLVISRPALRDFHEHAESFGSEDSEGNLILSIQFRDVVVRGSVDLTPFRNAWEQLPPLTNSTG